MIANGLLRARPVVDAPLLRRKAQVLHQAGGHALVLLRTELLEAIHPGFGFFRLSRVGQGAGKMQDDCRVPWTQTGGPPQYPDGIRRAIESLIGLPQVI